MIKIGLVDDHSLFRKGIANLLSYNPEFEVIMEAGNGSEFIGHAGKDKADIVLMDIEMPVMDGFELAKWIKTNMPSTKLLVLSMVNAEESVVKMLRMGIHGFLSKDIDANELYNAIKTIANGGYYYTDFISGILVDAMDNQTQTKNDNLINEREMQFLKLACSEFTYKEIADQMFLSVKTIDGYRNSLFEKLNVKSRVGLVLYAIRNEIVYL